MKLALSAACCLLLTLALATHPLQSSRGIVLAEAGPLEDLLAEGMDMLRSDERASEPLSASRGGVGAGALALQRLARAHLTFVCCSNLHSGQGARDSANQQLRSAQQRAPGRNPEQCSVFRCPHPDHEAKPREGHVATSNGCGSYGFKIHSKWHEPCCDESVWHSGAGSSGRGAAAVFLTLTLVVLDVAILLE